MNILHINTFNTGGAAKACLRIHVGLLDAGLNSRVLLRNKTNNDIPEVFEIWDDLNYIQKAKKLAEQKLLDAQHKNKLERFPPLTELFSFPKSIWDITRYSLYEWADVIHLHWVAGLVDYMSFFPKCNKKIVWTIHDFEPFSGGFHYLNGVDTSPYQTLIEENLSTKAKGMADNNISIVSPSHYLKQQSACSELFGNYQHQVIPNPVSNAFRYLDQQEARQQLGISAGQKMVLFVADNLNYQRKGLNYLQEAIEHIDDKTTQFYVIGEGKIKEYETLKKVGRVVSEEELNKWYAAADLFVIPSTDDNLPNTVSESVCSGTPVVGFNAGGISEMINVRVNGSLCRAFSSKSLANHIIQALEFEFDRCEISDEALSKYGYNSIIEQYKKCYKD